MKAIASYSLILLCSLSFTVAADEALYGAAPPPDAAFFRIVNASDEEISAMVGDDIELDVASLGVTEYGYASAPALKVSIEGQTVLSSASSGQQFTLVYSGADQAVSIIEDTPFENKRMALIRLYNIGHPTALAMKTQNGRTDILTGVAQGSSAERQIKAIKLAVAIFSEEERLADTEPLLLQKDNATSVFVVNGSSGVAVITQGAEQ